jgi:hypothetical protein
LTIGLECWEDTVSEFPQPCALCDVDDDASAKVFAAETNVWVGHEVVVPGGIAGIARL